MVVKGVFFDLGGTLFSYRNMGRGTAPLLLEACRRMDVAIEAATIGQAYAQANRDISVRYADKPYYLHKDLFRDTFLRFTQVLGIGFDAEVYAWYRERQHHAVIDNLHLKEDCLETLDHLKNRGLYLSIVSNIDDDMLDPLVAREGLDEFLHHWTSSEAAGSCKPDSRFFEVSLEKAGLSAETVLFVGDSPEHDIAGASAVGMQTVLIVEEGVQPPLQAGRETVAPDHRIEQLSELKDLVAA